jgi:Fic family protein
MEPSVFQPGFPGRHVPARASVLRDGRLMEESGIAFVPAPLPPALDPATLGRLLDPISKATAQLHLLAGAIRVLPDPKVLLRVFMRREVEHSSRIENTIASARELALFDAAQDTDRDEVREVHSNLVALEHGIASTDPLCLRLIREMHARLMAGVRGEDKSPGEFRRGQVYIGNERSGFKNARFVPPPPGPILEECLRDYEQFLNPTDRKPRTRYDPLIELAMSHYQFECIHPFADGNGRMGRLLITITGQKSGWLEFPLPYISPYFERTRQEYYDLLLRVSTHNDWSSWIEYFCRAVEVECADGMKRVRALDRLRTEYRHRAEAAGNSQNLPKLADHLFAQQAVTVAGVKQLLDVSQPAAQGLIDRLVAAGILTEVTGGKYKRVYLAEQIVRLIETDQPDQMVP